MLVPRFITANEIYQGRTKTFLLPTFSLPSAEKAVPEKVLFFSVAIPAANLGNREGFPSVTHCYIHEMSPIPPLLISSQGSSEKTLAHLKNVNNNHSQMGWTLMYRYLQMMLFIFNCSTYRLVRHENKYIFQANCLAVLSRRLLMRHGLIGKAV